MSPGRCLLGAGLRLGGDLARSQVLRSVTGAERRGKGQRQARGGATLPGPGEGRPALPLRPLSSEHWPVLNRLPPGPAMGSGSWCWPSPFCPQAPAPRPSALSAQCDRLDCTGGSRFRPVLPLSVSN